MVAHWAQMQEQARRRWGQLPTGRFEDLERSRDWLMCLFQILHGLTPGEAEREIDRWVAPASPARSWWRWWRAG